MRLRLASLALLLLALCGTASSSVAIDSWTSTNTVTKDSATTVKKETKDKVVAKIAVGVDETKRKTLDDIMGNTLFALVLKDEKKYDALPAFYKKAIENGILCELADADLLKKINKAQYNIDAVGPLVDLIHNPEETALNAAPEMKKLVNCDGTEKNQCFCVDKNPLLYCLAEAIKPTGTHGACRKAAFTALEGAGNGQYAKMLKNPPADDAPFEFNEDTAKLFCDATNDAVETAVKNLFASDALFWTMETIELAKYGAAGSGTDDAFALVCADQDVKASKFGACLCGLEKGVSFCFVQALGNFFKEADALDCAAKTVDGTKAPTPEQIAALSGKKAPGPAPGPGNDPNATTPAKPDAAATSSLLLASLSVAAAMLLRH